MLAGRRAFPGKTGSDVLAAVLTYEPDWTALPAGLPPRVGELLHRCLRKDARRRQQDAADARIELEDAAAEPAPAAARPTRRRVLLALTGLGAGAAGVAAGRWWPRPAVPAEPTAPGEPAAEPEWAGEMVLSLSGSLVPYFAVSPDGKSLAFVQLEDRVLQVAVMNLATGERRVLTDDREHGQASNLCWSRDGGRVYFQRSVAEQPVGVYRVSVLNGKTDPVLDGASFPQPLSDDRLLVGRRDAGGDLRLVRYWPDRGRTEPLSPVLDDTTPSPFLPFPGGRQVLFREKRPADAPAGPPPLKVLDLATGETRLWPANLAARSRIAFAADGQTVYAVVEVGRELRRVAALPADGTGRPHSVQTFTAPFINGLGTGPDGSLYVSLSARDIELLRFPTGGGNPERLARSDFFEEAPLALPDGRILFGETTAGRHRVVAVTPGQGGKPFIQTDAETWLPAAVLDSQRVALWIGPGRERDLAIVSLSDGRIVERHEMLGVGNVGRSMAALPGGGTVYFVREGRVWAYDPGKGRPREIGPGLGVAAAADGRSLYVALRGRDSVHLERRPVGAEAVGGEPVPLRGDLRLATNQTPASGATGPDGWLAVLVTARDEYFNAPAVLDPATGVVRPIRLDYDGRLQVATWTGDGRIVAVGFQQQNTIWRFRPPPAGGAP
jgi:hypothetical protein